MTAYISYPDKPYIEDEEDTMNKRMGELTSKTDVVEVSSPMSSGTTHTDTTSTPSPARRTASLPIATTRPGPRSGTLITSAR